MNYWIVYLTFLYLNYKTYFIQQQKVLSRWKLYIPLKLLKSKKYIALKSTLHYLDWQRNMCYYVNAFKSNWDVACIFKKITWKFYLKRKMYLSFLAWERIDIDDTCFTPVLENHQTVGKINTYIYSSIEFLQYFSLSLII